MTIQHKEEAQRAYRVCPTCAGEGTHGPGHVFTEADRDEYDPQDFDEMMQDYRDGVYDVRCETCLGARVVREDCPCVDCYEGRLEIAEMEAMERAERAFGC